MAEQKFKINTYEIDFKCDVCGIGHMRPTGEVIATYPAQYLINALFAVLK